LASAATAGTYRIKYNYLQAGPINRNR